MEINELVAEYKHMTTSKFMEKLEFILKHKPGFSNLNDSNRKAIYDIIKKFGEKIRDGRGLSRENIQDETHKLYLKRLELGITEGDLEDIREILGLFKK